MEVHRFEKDKQLDLNEQFVKRNNESLPSPDESGTQSLCLNGSSHCSSSLLTLEMSSVGSNRNSASSTHSDNLLRDQSSAPFISQAELNLKGSSSGKSIETCTSQSAKNGIKPIRDGVQVKLTPRKNKPKLANNIDKQILSNFEYNGSNIKSTISDDTIDTNAGGRSERTNSTLPINKPAKPAKPDRLKSSFQKDRADNVRDDESLHVFENEDVQKSGSSLGRRVNNRRQNEKFIVLPKDENKQQVTRNLKSLLKQSNASVRKNSQKKNNNKKVTFNQTVIVFCEEVEGSFENEEQLGLSQDHHSIEQSIPGSQTEYQEECAQYTNNVALQFEDNKEEFIDDARLLDLLLNKHQQSLNQINSDNQSISVDLNEKTTRTKPTSAESVPQNYSNKESMKDSKSSSAVESLITVRSHEVSTPKSNSKPVLSLNVATTDLIKKIKPVQSNTNVNFLPNAQTQVIKRTNDERAKSHHLKQIITSPFGETKTLEPLTDQRSMPTDVKERPSTVNQLNQDGHPKCYICHAIETGTLPRNASSDKLLNISAPVASNLINLRPINVNHSNIQSEFILPLKHSSCKSCNDIQSNQQASQRNLLQNILPTSPISYEIVNVIDQNGNKMKAVSVIYPSKNDGKSTGPDCRILIAHDATLQVAQSTNQSALMTSLAVQSTHVNQSNQVFKVPGNIVSNRIGVARPVLLVQQPLDSITHKGNFPNANEVRRLDGLRTFPNDLDPSTNNYQSTDENNNSVLLCRDLFKDSKKVRTKKRSDISDAEDDPTFGFSSRPSVKGVINSRTTLIGNKNEPAVNHTKTIDRKICNNQLRDVRMIGESKEVKTSTSHSMTNLQALSDPSVCTNQTNAPPIPNHMAVYGRYNSTVGFQETINN